MTTSGNDLLMNSGGTPWAKFPHIGASVGGKILDWPVAKQQTDFDTNEPLYWPNNDPKMEVVVKVATSERDPQIRDDDGTRAFHMSGNMLNAVRDAVRATAAEGLEPDGFLQVTYTGDGEAKSNRKNPPKQYTALYVRPASAGNVALMGQQPAQPATQPAPPAPPPVPTPSPPPPVPPTPTGDAEPQRPPTVDATLWQSMSPDQKRAVASAMQQRTG